MCLSGGRLFPLLLLLSKEGVKYIKQCSQIIFTLQPKWQKLWEWSMWKLFISLKEWGQILGRTKLQLICSFHGIIWYFRDYLTKTRYLSITLSMAWWRLLFCALSSKNFKCYYVKKILSKYYCLTWKTRLNYLFFRHSYRILCVPVFGKFCLHRIHFSYFKGIGNYVLKYFKVTWNYWLIQFKQPSKF